MSPLPRVRDCGNRLGVLVGVQYDRERGCYFSGIAQCASVWACPSCSAVIRQRRAVEVTEGVGRWLADGHGALLVTLTVPHYASDRLAELWQTVAGGFRGVLQHRQWRHWSERAGVAGSIRAFEVTRGPNGWHPHLHVLVLLERRASAADAEALARLLDNGTAGLWRNHVLDTLGRDINGYGVDVRSVWRNGEAVAAYVSKLDSGCWGVGAELARFDLKRGGFDSLSPFQIAEVACAGDAKASAWWAEFQEASKGRQALTFSAGLRRRLGLAETLSDDELVNDSPATSSFVCTIGAGDYDRIRPNSGEFLDLLTAAIREGSLEDVSAFLRLVYEVAPIEVAWLSTA